MTRTGYDSVTVSAVPAGGEVYLGYSDGKYANVEEMKARFPHRPVVRITVTGRTFDAEMADVESGDLTPAGGATWAKGRLQRQQFPVLYFSESSRSAILAALRLVGVDPRRVGMFAAQYDGKARLNQPGDIGKQYRSPSGTGAGKVTDGNYDVDIVRDYWPGLDPKPPAPVKPWYRRVLRRGMIGTDVIALKRRLRAHGYTGFTVLSPFFGGGCDRAVRAFQGAHHLGIDGVVGPRTAAALGR